MRSEPSEQRLKEVIASPETTNDPDAALTLLHGAFDELWRRREAHAIALCAGVADEG